jgi:hypothetical protein
LDKLIGHLVKFFHVGIRVDQAKSSAHRVIDKQEVGKLAPGAIVVVEVLLVLEPIGANLHHGAIFGAASWSAVDPDDGSLLVGDVLVLKVPEEQISVALGGNFDMTAMRMNASAGADEAETRANLPSMHLDIRAIRREPRQVANIIICR